MIALIDTEWKSVRTNYGRLNAPINFVDNGWVETSISRHASAHLVQVNKSERAMFAKLNGAQRHVSYALGRVPAEEQDGQRETTVQLCCWPRPFIDLQNSISLFVFSVRDIHKRRNPPQFPWTPIALGAECNCTACTVSIHHARDILSAFQKSNCGGGSLDFHPTCNINASQDIASVHHLKVST